MIIYETGQPPTGPKEDLLLQSAHRLVHTLQAIQEFENQEAQSRKNKEPELAPFTPQYWRKWQGNKRKDVVASKTAQIRAQADKKNRPQLSKPEELGPKLGFSSRHHRVVVIPFGTPPREPLPEADLVKNGSIDSPYLSRYHFITKSRSPSPHSAKKIPRSTTGQGVSFGLSTRDDYDKPTSLGQGPAMYNITRALDATLPNAGRCVFGNSRGSSILPSNNNPGPGYYTDVIKPLGSKDIHFSQAPKVSVFGGKVVHEPGPQHYLIPPCFGKEGPRFSFSSSPYEPPPAHQDEAELEPFVAFGHGCDFVQHVKYGRCLDGRCSKRAMWEGTAGLAAKGNPEMARKAEDLHKVLSDAKSPLHFAVIRGEAKVVSHVLLHGADPDARDEHDRTALHYAASMGDYRSVKRLVGNDQHPYVTPKGYIQARMKAQSNLVDKEGNSAMHLASRGGHWLIAQLLFQHGARCDLKNNKGETPLDMAKSDDVYSKMKFLLDIDKATEDLQRVRTKLERAKAAASSAAAESIHAVSHSSTDSSSSVSGTRKSSSLALSLGCQGPKGATERGVGPQGPGPHLPVTIPTMALS